MNVHPNQITQWKVQLQQRAADVFSGAGERQDAEEPKVNDLHAKIGQLAMEKDFWEGALGKLSAKK